jgi:electron transfer flavoprotein alpha subunit
MDKLLFLTHTEKDGSLSKHSLQVLTASVDMAKKCNAALTVGLWGGEIEKAADTIAGCGAEMFVGIEGEEFIPRYATDAMACEELIKLTESSLIISPATIRNNRVIPGVCQRLDGHIDTHISDYSVENDQLIVNRWYYRQRMLATLKRDAYPWFITIDSGLLPEWTGDSGTSNIKILSPEVDNQLQRTSLKGVQAPSSDKQTIKPDAELLFVAGAGWTKKQPDGAVKVERAAQLISDFINISGASLGSTKSMVDLSSEGQAVLPFMTNLNQVGQTGSTPRHPKGLATCCHGEEPHVVGWRFINERRAINMDANCGWAHGKADVLYVADAFAVMEKLKALLQE